MPFHFKALILVMVLTSITFALAKPLFIKFMTEDIFVRRRNVWLGLTLAAFLIPDFWLFVLVAIVIIWVGAAKDPNPAALYMFLLLALPPIREDIPTFGLINQIFGLDHMRLLSLVLLLPTALKMQSLADPYGIRALDSAAPRRLMAADILILMYAGLQLIMQFPNESVTASLRRILLLGIDVLLPYFVISRLCRTRALIVEAMAAFVLAAVVIVPLAAAEFVQGWILYAGLQERWGATHMIGYLKRGDYLRAQVTAGHSIVLGYAMSVAFGCWLYLPSRILGLGWRWLGFLAIVAGLVATLARGPWVGAVSILLMFLALGPNVANRSMKALGFLVVVAAVVAATPLGDRVIDHLPFVGSMDEGSVDYRRRLGEMSWILVLQNPVFGSPYFMQYMEELRQGEGIIDLVNVYAAIALSYGLVGLGLFLGFFGVIALNCLRAVRRFVSVDADLSMMGAGLLACIGGILVMIATTSNYLSITYIYWSLAALAYAYAQLSPNEAPSRTDLHSGFEDNQSWMSGRMSPLRRTGQSASRSSRSAGSSEL